tara:strand:+ start:577 stop:1602 length:1026 start_codon:yes stop_codon:yes gene_type:complete
LNSTTRFISDILFDKEIDLVLFPARNNDKFWDKFVKIGSSHYVIPALYYKLKQRDYLKLLNDELASYMVEIHNQNFKRNLELVKEVNEISDLFKSNNIDHVFLKGAALVSSVYNKSLGIRMVGDIDILISDDQILKAKSLMEDYGYKFLDTPFQSFIKNEKHLNRMINNKKIFAVELHLRISDKIKFECNKFINSKIFLNNIFIPSATDLLYHTIINFQLNDLGSIKAGFHLRTMFDVINISNTHPDLIKQVPNSVHVKKIQVVLKNLNLIHYKTPLNLLFYETRFRLINKFYFFSFINDFLFNIFKIITVSPSIRIKQIIALIFRKDYRIYALKKLRILK